MRSGILCFLVLGVTFFASWTYAQSIGEFYSVQRRGQNGGFEIPGTHTWQYLIQRGDLLSTGDTMPPNADFSGFVPAQGSSEKGYLCVNSEWTPGGMTVMEMDFDPVSETWQRSRSEKIDFSMFGGPTTAGTVRNCSGTVTPWETVVTCEEQAPSTGDANLDGYIDWGWNIEVDPVSRQVMDYDQDGIPDKIWAMGRMRHENIVLNTEGTIAYQGEDASFPGFLFKYELEEAGNLSVGTLFALRRQGSSGGYWIRIPNTSHYDRNNTIALASNLGATAFLRVEDVEISPDGKIYFASTTQAKVFRFDDMGDTIANFETFIDTGPHPIADTDRPDTVQFTSPDNMAFDEEGNLWITQDGGRGHIWVVGPGHTPVTPEVRIFANTPGGCEPTGLWFSPDHRFLFMSFQHPSPVNSQVMTDITGHSLVVDRDLTLVVARKEALGSPSALMGNGSWEEDPNWICLFPNPAQEALTGWLFAEEEGWYQSEVWDLQGRKCTDARVWLHPGKNEIQFQVGQLAPGVYSWRMWGEKQQWRGTFLKR